MRRGHDKYFRIKKGGENQVNMPEPTQSGVAPQANPAAPVTVTEPKAPVAPQAPAAPAAPLPDDTRERTRIQFEKLIDSNKRLFESNQRLATELQQRNQAAQTFSPIQNVPNAQTAQVNPQDFVETDPITGESLINTDKMQTHIAEINQRASNAEKAVQSYIKTSEEREIDRQNRETFVSYPELNPTNEETFNTSFNKQVRGVLFDSMYNPVDYGGRPLTFKEAADFVKAQNPQPTQSKPTSEEETKAKKAAEDAAKQAKELKEQGSAQVQSQPGNPPAPTNDAELQALRMQTRLGSTEALARRLVNAPHILPKGAKEVA